MKSKNTYLNNRIKIMQNLIKDMNFDLDEKIVFLIGEGLDFDFQVIRYPSLKNIKLWYGDGFNKDFEKIIFDKFKISYEEFKKEDENIFINFISDNLNKGNTVICRIDDELFKNYESVSDENIQAVRCITNVKINKINSNDIEMDYEGINVDNIFDGKLIIPLDKFLKAASSNVVPYAPQYSGYVIYKKDFYKEQINFHEILKQSILNICKKMKSQYEDRTANGITSLIKEIDMFKESIQSFKENDEIINKLFNIKFKILRKTLLYGSDTLYRCEFAYGLKESLKIIHNDELNGISDEFIQLGRHWLNFSRTISISNFRIKDKSEFINKLHDELKEIFIKEERLFTLLQNCNM